MTAAFAEGGDDVALSEARHGGRGARDDFGDPGAGGFARGGPGGDAEVGDAEVGDGDHLAGGVEQRAARIAGVDRGVGLDRAGDGEAVGRLSSAAVVPPAEVSATGVVAAASLTVVRVVVEPPPSAPLVKSTPTTRRPPASQGATIVAPSEGSSASVVMLRVHTATKVGRPGKRDLRGG